MKEKKICEVIVKSASQKVIDDITAQVLISKGVMAKKEFDRCSVCFTHTTSFSWPVGAEEELTRIATEASGNEGMIPKITEKQLIETCQSNAPYWFCEKSAGTYIQIEII